MNYLDTKKLTMELANEYYADNLDAFIAYIHPDVIMISVGKGQMVQGRENLIKVYEQRQNTGSYYTLSEMSCQAYPLTTGLCFVVAEMKVSTFHPNQKVATVNQRITANWQYFHDLEIEEGKKETGWFIMNLHVSVGLQAKNAPLNFVHFSESTQYQLMRQMDSAQKLSIRDQDGSLNYVSPMEILYVESDKVHCYIHTMKKSLYTRAYIAEMEEKLGQTFIRIHRSYLVNLRYITSIQNQEVVLSNEERLPISRRQLPKVRQAMESYVPNR